ncbi:MAG: thioesterase family protein [Gammaproteobacteria bacterium]|nr:thioesterase family protein [Gammaproteobacteria bacterium]
MQFVSKTLVQQKHVDELGHLNHVSAVDILQYARDDWYTAAELWDGRAWSGDEILATIVLNININYRLECFLDEALEIVTRPLHRGNKSFTLAHEIIKPDGRIAIDGSVTSVIMDMEQRQTLPVPDSLARYFTAGEKRN